MHVSAVAVVHACIICCAVGRSGAVSEPVPVPVPVLVLVLALLQPHHLRQPVLAVTHVHLHVNAHVRRGRSGGAVRRRSIGGARTRLP